MDIIYIYTFIVFRLLRIIFSDGSGTTNTRPARSLGHFLTLPHPPETQISPFESTCPARYQKINTRIPAGNFRVLKRA